VRYLLATGEEKDYISPLTGINGNAETCDKKAEKAPGIITTLFILIKNLINPPHIMCKKWQFSSA